jgi:hypothetical protein
MCFVRAYESLFLFQNKKSTSTIDADDDQLIHPVGAEGHYSH